MEFEVQKGGDSRSRMISVIDTSEILLAIENVRIFIYLSIRKYRIIRIDNFDQFFTRK